MNPLYAPMVLVILVSASILIAIIAERIYCRACKRFDAWFEFRYFTLDGGVEHVARVMVCRNCDHVRTLTCEPV